MNKENIYRIGIMQGRLTNKGGFLPQKFPWENWENEFKILEEQGIRYIEWMYNDENYMENPLVAQTEMLRKTQKERNVKIKSICANFFMKNSIIGAEFEKTSRNIEVLKKIILQAHILEIEKIVIPCFGENAIQNKGELNRLKNSIDLVKKELKEYGVKIAFEMDIPASEIREFLEALEKDLIGVCYDIGNATEKGYDVIEELELLKDRILDVHIKDKDINGNSVMLGKGNADFPSCINKLLDINYRGEYILESYYAEDAIKDTLDNYSYIKNICMGTR